jgi:hypothetical protein
MTRASEELAPEYERRNRGSHSHHPQQMLHGSLLIIKN